MDVNESGGDGWETIAKKDRKLKQPVQKYAPVRVNNNRNTFQSASRNSQPASKSVTSTKLQVISAAKSTSPIKIEDKSLYTQVSEAKVILAPEPEPSPPVTAIPTRVFGDSMIDYLRSHESLFTSPLSIRGLINGSSSCFINAVLQSLCASCTFTTVICNAIDVVQVKYLEYCLLLSPTVVQSETLRNEFMYQSMMPHLPYWHQLLTFVQRFRKPAEVNSVGSSSSSVNSKHNANHQANDSTCFSPESYLTTMLTKFRSVVAANNGFDHSFDRMTIHSSNTSTIKSPFGLSLQTHCESRFGGRNTQEDAMEFLTFLLDILHEELQLLPVINPFIANAVSNGDAPVTIETERDSDSSDEVWCDPLTRPVSPHDYDSSHSRDSNSADIHSNNDNDDGWTEVGSQSKAYKVIIDQPSYLSTRQEVNSTVISQLFHFILRSAVHYESKRTISVTFQKSHCLTLNVDSASVPRKWANTPTASPTYVSVGHKGKSSMSSLSLHNSSSHGNNVSQHAQDSIQSQTQNPNTSQVCSLEDVLSGYFHEDVISNTPHHSIIKKLTFSHLPKVLIIQLNRMAYDVRTNASIKLSRPVSYTETLHIPISYMSDDLIVAKHWKRSYHNSSEGCQYNLFAVICHLGKQTSKGHYTSFCKSNEQWREMNDAKIRMVTVEEALEARSTAYVLMYQLQEE